MTENNKDKPTILIVDDVNENLHAMMNILRDQYAVVAATSGEKALELAARKPQPSLIMLDIKMPGMDGYEVLRRLKSNPVTADIPIIIVTGLSESEDEAAGLKMGAADYITKPFNPDWLKLRILTQIELRRYRRKPVPPGMNVDDAPQGHFSILIVDDMPENIHELISALSGQYRIMVANNGPKAVELVQGTTPPDLILLDIVMPEMDGYEVCRRIKSTEAGNRIPVIFLSVRNESLEKVRGFSIGGADYITKPFDIDEARARIHTQLELSLLQRFFEQKVAQRTAALQETMSQLRLHAQVFESSREGILITDGNNNLVAVNRAFTEITGYPPDEVIGKNPRLLASGRHDKPFYDAMWHDILNQGHWQGEVLSRRKNGDIYPEWLSISIVRNQDGQIVQYIGILNDLSKYKIAEERIQFLSNFDSLTHLPNRGLLRDRAQLALAGAMRTHSPVALMYIDLDRFKIVNDSLGHSVGDQLLQALSERLTGHLYADDTLCHQGGDEFILLLPNTDVDEAAHVARKMLDIIAQPFIINGQRLTLTASIGVAEFPQDGDNFEQLAQSADVALYRAKQSGRNTFQFFTRQMHEQAHEVLQVENELRQALEQGEFLLHYQPQVDTKTSKIIGIEALIRWQHPQKGLVPPAHFIPIAEESGLIIDIGNWVLHTAIQQLVDWKNAGLPIVPVAINLSVVQFRQDTLYQTVAQALRASKLDPAMLELEMTEGIAMENSERTIKVLDQLHALGVGLSIDDFGTGYSSLSYLKRFNIDKLKIDQSFVRDLGRDPEDAAIVTAIIGMAKGLGFRTIAEGVETQEQLDFLLEKQCDEIQGYLFSRPLLAEVLAELLRNGGALGACRT